MFLRGVRFGLLLQFAVGPVCLMVFSTAGGLGFPMGALAALAATLAGSVANTFLPWRIMVFLNVCVGVAIIFFALKMAGLKRGS